MHRVTRARQSFWYSRESPFGVALLLRSEYLKGFSPMKSKKLSSRAAKSSGPDRGEVMNGAEILVSCLEREGTRIVFAYPGGASMPIHQALTKSKKIRVVLASARAGGCVCRRGLRAGYGKAGCLHGDIGPRCDESRHRHCRCLHGLGSAGGNYRAGQSEA